MLELRTYTLASEDALKQYADIHWKRHIPSLAAFGITTRHVWVEVGADEPRLIAVVEYAPGSDPREVTARYMGSDAFRADMDGFRMDAILKVTSQFVEAASSDPER